MAMMYSDTYERSTYHESVVDRGTGSCVRSTSDIQNVDLFLDGELHKPMSQTSHASVQMSELEQNIMGNMFDKH